MISLRRVLFVLLFGILISGQTDVSAAEPMRRNDSLYVNTLNMTEEEIREVYGPPDTTANMPTLQERVGDNIQYEKRIYNHKQQVIVGGVIMLCVALVMVMMNNYNPMR
ncbi:MAG: hypothetical protein LBR60_02755 [Fibrobacter sp.]|jgi:hypothetical protein|nr:hypothetical protein [Fibrobacter sp.]